MPTQVKHTTYAYFCSDESVLTTDLLDGKSLQANTWCFEDGNYTGALKAARVEIVYHLEANQAEMQELAAKTLASRIEALEAEHAKKIAVLRAGLDRLQAITFDNFEVS